MDNNFDRLQEANNNVDSVIEKVWKQAEENLNKMKPKYIPKTQVGMNKKQKGIMRSFVGRMPSLELKPKQLNLSKYTGLTNEKKAILKEHMGSVSFKIDTSAVREWCKYGVEVYEPEEDDMTTMMKRGYTIYEE